MPREGEKKRKKMMFPAAAHVSRGPHKKMKSARSRVAAQMLLSVACFVPLGCGGTSSSACYGLPALVCDSPAPSLGKLVLRGGSDDGDGDDDRNDEEAAVKSMSRLLKRYQPEEVAEATDFLSKRLRAQTAGTGEINIGAGSVRAQYADTLEQVLRVGAQPIRSGW